jgi:Putative bacterial sensory transduction regulator
MAEIDLARSHVERCLQDLLAVHDVTPDADGFYPYPSATSFCWIGVDPGDPPVVRAVACATVGVKMSMRLLRELNELNARGGMTRVYWDDRDVYVEQAMPAYAVDRRSLGHAAHSVATLADEVGPVIAAVFGGQTPLAEV